MALKHTIAKREEFDALAEPVRALYKEDGGKWVLDVEGVVPEAKYTDVANKLTEFRDNNRVLFAENEKLKPVVDKLKKTAGNEDFDAFFTEHTTLKTKVKALDDKGITKPDDLNAAIEAALKPVKDALASEQTARATAQAQANASRFRELISADAVKGGVRPQSMRHVLREAEDVFELKDGKIAAKAGVKHPTDPLKEMTPPDWLQQLASSDDYLFGESVGGGANNQHGSGGHGGRPGARQLINPSPEEMGRHTDAIAKGEVVVVRQ